MKLEQIVTVLKQASPTMTIPKVFFQIMGLNYGDKLIVSFDFENKCMIVRKKDE